MKTNKSITLFGTYIDNHLYSRNSSIKKSLQILGYEIIELRPSLKSTFNKNRKFGSFFHFFWTIKRLLIQWLSLCKHTQYLRKQPIILVPYPSHADILLLKILLLGKKPIIIMDAFLGLHETIVEDRKLFKKNGVISFLVRIWENYALSIADIVLLDTEIQCVRLSNKYHMSLRKFKALPVGIDEGIWCSTEYPNIIDEFKVVFWGTFIPLHGVNTIIDAASILLKLSPSVKILIIGTGQTAATIKNKLIRHWPSNLEWIDKIIQHEKIAVYAKQAHCILGIFGESEKASSVIPYKIYQALAINRPVITRKSYIFNTDLTEFSIYTVEPNSPQQLAEKIYYLASNQEVKKTKPTSRNYYDMFLSGDVIVTRLSGIVSGLKNVK